jgi:hypothetical protein
MPSPYVAPKANVDRRMPVTPVTWTRRFVLIAIASATLFLPQFELFDTLGRFMSADEALRILSAGFLGIASTPWAIAGIACSILVLFCARPRKDVAAVIGLLAVGYLVLKGVLGRDFVLVGPFTLLTFILWLYVSISTFRAATRSEAREG